MGMTELLSLVDKLGVPVAALIALGLGIRASLIWLAPRVDKVVDAHVGFVKTVETQVDRQTTIMEAQIVTTQSIAESQEQHGRLIEDLHRHQFPPAAVLVTGNTTINTQKKSNGEHDITIHESK